MLYEVADRVCDLVKPSLDVGKMRRLYGVAEHMILKYPYCCFADDFLRDRASVLCLILVSNPFHSTD